MPRWKYTLKYVLVRKYHGEETQDVRKVGVDYLLFKGIVSRDGLSTETIGV
jgi:hypothetical protein